MIRASYDHMKAIADKEKNDLNKLKEIDEYELMTEKDDAYKTSQEKKYC